MKQKLNLKNIKNKKSLLAMLIILSLGIVGGTLAIFRLSHSVPNDLTIANMDVVLEEHFDTESSTFSADAMTIEKDVDVRNCGTADTLVRVSYAEFFYDPQYLADQYIDAYTTVVNYNDFGEVVQKNWTQEFESDWIYHDGWYYYTKVFAGNEEKITCSESSVVAAEASESEKYTLSSEVEYFDTLIENPTVAPEYTEGVSANTLHILDSVTLRNYSSSPHPYIGLEYRLDFSMESVQATTDAVKDLWGFEVDITDEGEVVWPFSE